MGCISERCSSSTQSGAYVMFKEKRKECKKI